MVKGPAYELSEKFKKLEELWSKFFFQNNLLNQSERWRIDPFTNINNNNNINFPYFSTFVALF